MVSSFNGILRIVKNKGEPMFWCKKNVKQVEDFMNFETRNTGRNSNFLLILEKKL